ncbi:MAG TPA: DUF6152 family protein [Xanthobacteraceae bacterium]
MKTAVSALAIGMLALSGPALAHHPFASEFDAQAPLTLSGTITKVDWVDPHVLLQMDVKDPNGQTRNWTLDLASPAMLQRKGWTKDSVKQGESITVKGYRAKSEPFTAAARMVEIQGKQMSAADDDDGGPKQ